MNNSWKYLIIIGIVSLLAVIGWEAYQIATGGRVKFALTVLPMERDYILSPALYELLEKDPNYIPESTTDNNSTNSSN
jgi:hypothetical protein